MTPYGLNSEKIVSVVQYLDIPSASRFTGISITKIYRFIHSGDLVVYKENGKLVVKVQDILRKKSRMKDSELLEPAFMNFISEVKSEKTS